MASEHHIDSFDTPSFFQLHDLNSDGYWDREEIEAIYGVHHVYAQKQSKDDVEHQKKAEHIVNEVLARIDTDKDGKVSLEEFKTAGLERLPSFASLGAEGHHYDVESEFFLHHEEEFHSTPETQTDESYTHQEDIDHFMHHDQIERIEAEKEAKFQGLTVEEVLKQHELYARKGLSSTGEPETRAGEATTKPSAPEHPHDDQRPMEPIADQSRGPPKYARVPPPEKQDPRVKYSGAAQRIKSQSEWGTGEQGYKAPKSPAEKLRKNMPYKYKFKRNWGDF